MILSAIAAIGSIGSAIYSGIKASQANNEANRQTARYRDDKRRWYQAEQARDYTSRADVQTLLAKQRDLLTDQYRRTRATNVVAGGTDASLALQRDAINRTVANTGASIAAQGARYKDAISAEGRNVDANLFAQQVASQRQKAQAIATAGGQASSAFANIAGADNNTWSDDLAAFGLGGKKKKSYDGQTGMA